MLSLVRTGSHMIYITTAGDTQELIDSIKGVSFKKGRNIMETYNHSGIGDTVVQCRSLSADKIVSYQTETPVEMILCSIINHRLSDKIDSIRFASPNIFMRLLGDKMDAAIDQIIKDYGAAEIEGSCMMHNLESEAVLLNFTRAPLNRIVLSEEIYRRALLIDRPYGQLLLRLRAKAQEYLNTAMGSPDWNDMSITMFDAMDQFNLHYQRLILVLQGLDIGVVEGESWIPEYTIALRKSEVYQVRLLTPLPPNEIKRLAMALEYDDDGRRVVDFDVYNGKKKLGWADERNYLGGGTRSEIGVMHRKRMLAILPDVIKEELAALDAEIDKSGPVKG
ncbi:hypothetical protein FACS1894216_03650 [Synergistales bacterium]|nr:hypothetical protein FACS1894216_03650 [Synergistales bacterium]